MEIFYGQTAPRFAAGKKFRNVRNFLTPEAEATKVFVVGHYPRIVSAYKNLGIEVVVLADDDPRLDYPDGESPSTNFSQAEIKGDQTNVADKSLVEIPEGWESMPWADLRRLAVSVSQGVPIVNKADAEKAIEAYLAFRSSLAVAFAPADTAKED